MHPNSFGCGVDGAGYVWEENKNKRRGQKMINDKRKFRIIAFVVMLVASMFVCCASAEEPQMEWNKTFGGSGAEWGWSVQQTTDGGYIIAGYTDSFGAGQEDIYLIKTDQKGELVWSKTFGGTSEDVGYSVQQTIDGGYIIAGRTASFGAGNCDVYLIKTDQNGNEEWSKTFGGTCLDSGESVQQSSDGGYIIAGYTFSFGAGSADVYLIKTDKNGKLEWSKTFGGTHWDGGKSVQQTIDGGYVIAGYMDSFGAGSYDDYLMNYDVYLIKTDEKGDEEWSKTFGGAANDHGYSVQQTSDAGYIITGSTRSFGAHIEDVYLIKTDKNGNEEWNKTFGEADGNCGYSVQQTSDGGYIIAGSTLSLEGPKFEVYLIKTDPNGKLEWSKTFRRSDVDAGYSGQQTSDGGYIIAGCTFFYGSDVWLIKLAPPPMPTISITIDKFKYSPSDTMTITMEITNPTEGSVTFQWYWGVPPYSIWIPVTSASIPPGYDDTLDFSFTIPDWGSTPFGNVFYVQLLDESGEVLDADVTWWAYSSGGKAMPAAEVDIAKEIKKTVERVELPN